MPNIVSSNADEIIGQNEMVETKKEEFVESVPTDQNEKESTPEENPSNSDITDAKTSNEPSMESSMESNFYKGSSNFSRRSSADVSPPHSDNEGLFHYLCLSLEVLSC